MSLIAGSTREQTHLLPAALDDCIGSDNPSCALKARCTKAAHRRVSRWEQGTSLERTAAEKAKPALLAQSKTLIKHCWGTLKWLPSGGFSLRGKEKVGAQTFGALWLRSEKGLGRARQRSLVGELQYFKPNGAPHEFGHYPDARSGSIF